MQVILTPSDERQLDDKLGFSLERFGLAVAKRTLARIERAFTVLGAFPYSGRQRENGALYETAVPRTPFVIVYRIELESDIVRILGFFYGAQDREVFDPE